MYILLKLGTLTIKNKRFRFFVHFSKQSTQANINFGNSKINIQSLMT